MKKIKLTLSLLILAIYGLFGCTTKALAIDRKAISISPTSEKIILTPGETFRSGFSIVNPNTVAEDLNYLASIGTYSTASGPDGKDDYGSADLETITSLNEIMNWTTIDNPTGTIAPGQSQTLSYTITVPKDAPAGGQYMTILIRENPNLTDVNNDSSNVSQIMQMGFVVYAEVAGNTHKEGAILENNIPSFLTNGKLETSARVKNSGNVHTDAEIILQVWPMFSDEEICTNEEDASLTFILPDTERYHVETCNLPAIGIFRAKQTVKIFGEESIVEKTVIVCPLWLIFVILFVVIALIIWIIIRIKSRKKA